MTGEFLGPPEILSKSVKERKKYFEGYTLAHRFLKEAAERVMSLIENPCGAAFIWIVGPTGVGKTTLIKRIEQRVWQHAIALVEQDKGIVPVVKVEAISPESGNFNWKDYFVRALEAIEEPLIRHKICPDSSTPAGASVVRPIARAVAPELRRAMEHVLKFRRVRVLIIDEAEHFAKVSSGKRIQDQLDCLKSMANLTGTLHVLAGTYELLPFLDLSAQLSRRGHVVHLNRYHADRREEVEEFIQAIEAFQGHIPLEHPPDLLEHWEDLYQRSVGCVGILKTWFNSAVGIALDSGGPSVTWNHFREVAPNPRRCLRIAADAVEGEARLAESSETLTALRDILGLSYPDKLLKAVPSKDDTKATGKKRRPGERNPARDPVGGGATV